MQAPPSPRNRSLRLSAEDRARLSPALEAALELGSGSGAIALPGPGPAAPGAEAGPGSGLVIAGDCLAVLPRLAPASVDLLVADPPYNLDKAFGSRSGSRMSDEDYEAYTASWLEACLPLLKPGASVYACCDWRGGAAMQRALGRRLVLRNRITWEREKGRAAARNWKGAHEDIWFATVSGEYRFDAAAVRLRRRVRAPYRDGAGGPKDWGDGPDGKLRDTAASNLWTDLVVPFWSMPENTSHPTQKPEKLLAKLLLASSRPGDLVLDPFLGSGTTAVVAKKLGRRFVGIEADPEHCLAALRRLELAEADRRIQGYEEGLFWERNSGPRRSR
ncbi:MAG TPA: site-specific DNA-methyltransferase [Spirochaetia bacterium]|nr:site-specific DNA-methyltransferase [Spirochaetia bacterium]